MDKKEKVDQNKEDEKKRKMDENLDRELEQSFPASDPPSHSRPDNDDKRFKKKSQ